MQAVILAGGPLTDYTMVQVPADALLICADRGVRYAEQLGLHPDVMLGDFDSYGSIPAGEAVQVYPKEKDDTDLMLACRYAVEKGVKSVTIYGGLGGRLDHTIANLQALRWLAEHGVWAELLSENNRASLQFPGTRQYPGRAGWNFSLFAMTEQCILTTTGVQYPLTHGTLQANFPLGISNSILQELASVTVEEGILLVIASRD